MITGIILSFKNAVILSLSKNRQNTKFLVMNDKTLYIVATPIGNLGDITARALETLKAVEVIFCEDTRQTLKLLSHFEFSKKLISLHQHTDEQRTIDLLTEYKSIAYVSDAGTPGISDPGGRLVALAIKAGWKIVPIPGVSAVIAALSISGFPTDKFLFLGFMPHKGKTKMMETIKNSNMTICFYESTHRIIKTLEELKKYLEPTRPIVVARELTKMFETVYRGTLEEIIPELEKQSKGEFVVVVAGK